MSANPTATPTPGAPAPPTIPKDLRTGLAGLWGRLSQSVLPDVHYLDGEILKLTIRMAPYRKNVPRTFIRGGGLILIISLVLTGLSFLPGWPPSARFWFGAMVVLGLYLFGYGLQSLLLYEQWQFILTDKRIILITPDPSRHGFADAIYLKQGKIQVLDTNWSSSPFWGIFQAIKGSRDVMLSMSGYEFQETGAKVKGGLRFPDVTPDNIRRLEALIFG